VHPELINNAEKWRNTTEVSLFQKRTKLFWIWVNYVWMQLHSSQSRVERLLWLCGYWVKLISRSLTRWLSPYRSLPRMLQLYPASNSYFISIDKPTVVLKHFLKILWANSVHIKTFTIILLLSKFRFLLLSKFRILRSQIHQLLRLYRVSPLWRQGFKRDNHMYISSRVKSALRKFSEGKDHDCNSFMSDVSVLYKSCVSYLGKWTTFAEFQSFD